jgi:hypothetical protein
MGAVADGDGALNQVSKGAVAGDAAGIFARASDGDRGDTISYSIDDARFAIDGTRVVRWPPARRLMRRARRRWR